MRKMRLDQALVQRGLVSSRSQAESYIRLGKVSVNQNIITKTGTGVQDSDSIVLKAPEQYVGRAGLKLASVAAVLALDFHHKTVLDVGSSTGGFTDYALRHGAKKVIAVDVGTNQLHPTLRTHPSVELHEKTDIRTFRTKEQLDLVLIDVSFVALRNILPAVIALATPTTEIIAMVKPQFEATPDLKHKGVIKNDRVRREILKQFESWAKQHFVIVNKADSDVAGAKGNRERFYHLKLAA